MDVVAVYLEAEAQVVVTTGFVTDWHVTGNGQDSTFTASIQLDKPPERRAAPPGSDISLVTAGQPTAREFLDKAVDETVSRETTRAPENEYVGRVCWNCDKRIKEGEFAHEEDGMTVHDDCDQPTKEVWT